jgi:hypothetical protein
MLIVSQGTSPSVNEAETEAQITSQTNLGTGMRVRIFQTQFDNAFRVFNDVHHIAV